MFGCLEDEQKPVKQVEAETVKNHPAQKLELLSPKTGTNVAKVAYER